MRRITGTALIVVALVGRLGALTFPVWSYTGRSRTAEPNLAAGTVPTHWGPLSAADRDLIVRVRLAGLWELPAGQQALERAPTAAIKEAADHLVVGHTELDRRVRGVARDLGVELPNQPNAQQRGWLKELTEATGKEYERKFANLLRAAHGRIFPAIGAVRNSTRNSLVRQLAAEANQTVLDHIRVLEKTGEVDFGATATATATVAAPAPAPDDAATGSTTVGLTAVPAGPLPPVTGVP